MLSAAILCLTLTPAAPPADEPVPLWGRCEASFTADEGALPETEFGVEVTSPSGRARVVPGFWDGGRTWRVRFLPDEDGKWRFQTKAKRGTGLDGQAGAFTVRKP